MILRSPRSVYFLLVTACCAATATLEAKDSSVFEPLDPTEQVSAQPNVPDVPGLPEVLLLGDSISFGYTQPVRILLKGLANVHHGGQRRFNSGYALAHLDDFLEGRKWDVIHFNYGLWDAKYVDEHGDDVAVDKGHQIASPSEYEKNMRELVARLKRTGAKLIFATSTPVPPGTLCRAEEGERPYNEVAVRVMRECGVPIDDLYAHILPYQGELQLPHDPHFTPGGYEELAKPIAAAVIAALPVQPLQVPPAQPVLGTMAGKTLAAGESIAMQWIPPGTFRMGSDEGGYRNEYPARTVHITRGFWVGRYDVTQEQWRILMGASYFKPSDSTVAAFNVSWHDAMDFCRRLTQLERAAGRIPAGYEYRLPTEAEWEYACRAGTTTDYGGDNVLDDMGWDYMNIKGGQNDKAAQAVGQKRPNAWGLYDMHGNVWQWCLDWYGPYRGDEITDPAGPSSGAVRVMRGGGWTSLAPACRSAARGWAGPDDRYVTTGFRVALAPAILLSETTQKPPVGADSAAVQNPPL